MAKFWIRLDMWEPYSRPSLDDCKQKMNSTIKPSPCKTCGSLYHSAMYHKPRTAIKVNLEPKRKPIKRATTYIKRAASLKQQGKHYNIWKETRSRWLAERGHLNGLQCHYCGVGLDTSTLTLDHRIPRSRAPHLRYKVSNLVPCCFTCNGLKGSVDHDHYKHTCPDDTRQGIT